MRNKGQVLRGEGYVLRDKGMDTGTIKIKSFTNLVAWQEGHRLVLGIYQSTRNFPKEEMFGLTSQLRRAVVSVTSNIAEGFSRNGGKEKLQFYRMALGSLTEIQNQPLIAKDVEFLARDEFTKIANRTIIVSKLLNGLMKSIGNRSRSLNT